MKNRFKKWLALFTAVAILTVFLPTASAAEYDGKTVILHTNDVHGEIGKYAYVAGIREDLEEKGAEVIVVDAGDFSQGTSYVSINKGMNAVTLMNAVGYDIVVPGNHEFDYGIEALLENLDAAEFDVVCAGVVKGEYPLFPENTVYETRGGLRIGFFGLDTPETQTKANPALIKGIGFAAGERLYAAAEKQVAALAEADLVVCLAHLGTDKASEPNTSYDLYGHVEGIDLIIDGHSHTAMTEGEHGEPIVSTGSAFENVGVIVIDEDTGVIEDNYLIGLDDTVPADAKVGALAEGIAAGVNEEYGAVFADSTVDLNGEKAPGNRTQETNLGDLVTDAMLWAVTESGAVTDVPADNVVAVTNGGGIRAWIRKGEITKNDVNTVLPFGNTLTVVYITGDKLLEALEASTFCTPEAIGGFPQVAGMSFTVDTGKAYDAAQETYPGSTYYGPASISRVTVTSVNGKDFDPDAVYAVVTNDFCSAGGDTYYAFASADRQLDTGLPLDEVLMDYIGTELGGEVGQEYASAQGRITVRMSFGNRIKAFFLNAWNAIKNFFAGIAAWFAELFGGKP